MREVGLMLFVACFITIRSRLRKKGKKVEYKFCSSVCSTFSTSFFTAELHVIDVIALCAVSLLCPSLAIVVLVLTASFGFAFSAWFGTIDVHILGILLTFALSLPFIAIHFMVRAFIFAFLARDWAVLQHPTGIGLTLAISSPSCTVPKRWLQLQYEKYWAYKLLDEAASASVFCNGFFKEPRPPPIFLKLTCWSLGTRDRVWLSEHSRWV